MTLLVAASAQAAVIAHVLLDEAVAVVAADDRIGQVHVIDLGLQLAAVPFGDPAAEDGGDLGRLADAAIGIEQPLAELVESGTAVEHKVVAELGLGEEQAMLTAGVLALGCGEERGEGGEPLLAAGDEIARGSTGRRDPGGVWGAALRVNAFASCRKSMPSSRIRLARQ